jgi:hypothetical protein
VKLCLALSDVGSFHAACSETVKGIFKLLESAERRCALKTSFNIRDSTVPESFIFRRLITNIKQCTPLFVRPHWLHGYAEVSNCVMQWCSATLVTQIC